MWPDIEKALVKGLREHVGVGRVATRVPGDVEALPGFIRVIRGPGSDDKITDSPTMDVETFAPAYGEAMRLAQQSRAYLHTLTGQRIGNVLVDSVRTSATPTEVYYADEVERIVASYRFEFRK